MVDKGVSQLQGAAFLATQVSLQRCARVLRGGLSVTLRGLKAAHAVFILKCTTHYNAKAESAGFAAMAEGLGKLCL